MIRFVDTHTHLYDSAYFQAFESEDDAVLRAVSAGVDRLILPDIDSQTREGMISLARRHPQHCRFCIGLHPTEVHPDNFDQEMEEVLRASLRYKDEMVAIGECGLDYYWSKEHIALQQMAFKEQLLLSDTLDKPVIIHCREATEDCLRLLKEHKGPHTRGVFHAFSGSAETYREIKKIGNFLVGLGGVLTYKNAGIAKALEEIDIEDIVLETDAPYLPPVPYRGKRNESAYIPLIASKIAEVKGLSVEEVAQITTENAQKMFFAGNFW